MPVEDTRPVHPSSRQALWSSVCRALMGFVAKRRADQITWQMRSLEQVSVPRQGHFIPSHQKCGLVVRSFLDKAVGALSVHWEARINYFGAYRKKNGLKCSTRLFRYWYENSETKLNEQKEKKSIKKSERTVQILYLRHDRERHGQRSNYRRDSKLQSKWLFQPLREAWWLTFGC